MHDSNGQLVVAYVFKLTSPNIISWSGFGLLWPTAIRELRRTERPKVTWQYHIKIYVNNENTNLRRVCTRMVNLQI